MIDRLLPKSYLFCLRNLDCWDCLNEYIALNKHLPDIPSVEQVQQEGIQVGEMEVKLLQKVEEITLYLIELKRENDELRQEVMRLKRQMQGDKPASYPRR